MENETNKLWDSFNMRDCPSIEINDNNFENIQINDWVIIDGFSSCYQVYNRTKYKLFLSDYCYENNNSVDRYETISYIRDETVKICKSIFKSGFDSKTTELFANFIHPSSEIEVKSTQIFDKIRPGDFVRQKGENYYCGVIKI